MSTFSETPIGFGGQGAAMGTSNVQSQRLLCVCLETGVMLLDFVPVSA